MTGRLVGDVDKNIPLAGYCFPQQDSLQNDRSPCRGMSIKISLADYWLPQEDSLQNDRSLCRKLSIKNFVPQVTASHNKILCRMTGCLIGNVDKKISLAGYCLPQQDSLQNDRSPIRGMSIKNFVSQAH
jgi:hypothetical protein